MKTLNWILIAVLCVFCIGIQIGYVVYSDAYPKEYKKVENRYKQMMIQRLQGKDLEYYNSIGTTTKQRYLDATNIQQRYLGNTVEKIIKDNTQIKKLDSN